ncbi:MAG: 3-hydroxyacyl-ACP dehydratase FabZ [Candidatus Caenarcaniphilales bacterium]|nr:3-hydroxyacyl-ACP dehydratase FabZ [Candidatus Caenarcaniphilales bacterium]
MAFTAVNLKLPLEKPLGSEEIKYLLPHRYPLLLVDRVTEIGEDYIKGYKNLTFNEDFFRGHFPGIPIMPGVYMAEATAQLASIFEIIRVKKEEGENVEKIGVFLGIDNARFKAMVRPGDRLDMEANKMWLKRNVGKFSVKAFNEGKIAFSAELSFAILDRKDAEF